MTARAATAAGMISGAVVDLLAPDWRTVDFSDMAFGLARLPRWAAQSRRRPISVAEHSRLVGALAPAPLRLAALLHDAHEYAFGDLISPAQAAIVAMAGVHARDAIDMIKFRLDRAIARRLLADSALAPDVLTEADEAFALAGEMRLEPVRAADAAAAGIEEKALGWGGAPVFCAALPPAEPDPQEIALRWLDDIRAAVRARYGAPA